MTNFPKWVEEETECNFCREMMELKDVQISEEGDDVNAIYVCHNPKCYHFKLFKYEHEFVIIYHGRKETYNKFLRGKNKDELTTTGISGNFWGEAK